LWGSCLSKLSFQYCQWAGDGKYCLDGNKEHEAGMYLTKAAITNPGPGINKSKRNEQQAQCNKEGDTKVKSQDKIRKRCHKNIFIY